MQLPRRIAPMIPGTCCSEEKNTCIHSHIIIVVIYYDVHTEAFLKICFFIAQKNTFLINYQKISLFPKSCLLTLKRLVMVL